MKLKHLSAVLVLALLFTSCNPFISKELRQKNRCNDKVDKEFKRRDRVKKRIKKKCPDAVVMDTIKIPFEVKVPEIKIKDSIDVKVIVDSAKVDSLTNVLKNLNSREEKIKYVTNFIKENFFLDTLITDTLYDLRFTIQNGKFGYDVHIKERKIEGEAKAPIEETKNIELNPIEKLMNWLGGMYWSAFWLILLFLIGYILYRKIFK